MKNPLSNLTLLVYSLIALNGNAQTPVSSYTTTTSTSDQSSFTETGYIPANSTVYNTHIPRGNNSYTSYFGTDYPSTVASTLLITGFVAGSKTFTRISASPTTPFTKINFQRKDNTAYTGNRFSGFFEYSSVRTAGGTEQYNIRDNGDLNIYIKPSQVTTMEAALNNFSLSYGSDNLFSNLGTGNAGTQGSTLAESGNNIERVDLIYQPGIQGSTTDELAGMGVMINERGGNDNFKVAAITGLDGSGNVATLGSVISITSDTWETASGPEISTIVFMGAEGAGNIKPKELVSMATVVSPPTVKQKVAGLFFSLADLGIPINTKLYGLAIFPGDITSEYLTLTSAPTNTPDAGDGGLDLMSGSFMAVESSILPVTLVSFGAKIAEDKPLLSWSTTAESNFSGFELLHSADSKTWSSRGFFAAREESGPVKKYDFTDQQAIAGLNYYRLKLVDKDGSSALSKVVSVAIDVPSLLFPNPTADRLHIQNITKDLSSIQKLVILSQDGRLVKSTSTINNTLLTNGLSIRDLPNGQYILQVVYSTQDSQSFKFVVLK